MILQYEEDDEEEELDEEEVSTFMITKERAEDLRAMTRRLRSWEKSGSGHVVRQ